MTSQLENVQFVRLVMVLTLLPDSVLILQHTRENSLPLLLDGSLILLLDSSFVRILLLLLLLAAKLPLIKPMLQRTVVPPDSTPRKLLPVLVSSPVLLAVP
jgi:hypothetical protein